MTAEPYSVLAFYGCRIDTDALEAFASAARGWFEQCGLSPTHAAVVRTGKRVRIATARGALSRLARDGYEGVEGIELTCALPDAYGPMLDFAMLAGWHKESAVVCLRAQDGHIGGEWFKATARSLAGIVRPAYGIGFVRPGPQEAVLYVHGIGYGDREGEGRAAYIEALNRSFWMDAQSERVWEQGILRDVYPLNFLSPAQLARPAGDRPLSAWIEADPRRGRLEEAGAGLTSWEVEERERNRIRRELWDRGVIFNWARDIEGAAAHPYAAEVVLSYED